MRSPVNHAYRRLAFHEETADRLHVDENYLAARRQTELRARRSVVPTTFSRLETRRSDRGRRRCHAFVGGCGIVFGAIDVRVHP